MAVLKVATSHKMKMAVRENGQLTATLSLADSSASINLDQVPRWNIAMFSNKNILIYQTPLR